MRNNGQSPDTISEIIGRAAYPMQFWRQASAVSTYDATVPDYQFWDTLRRGKAVGYEFGGLFCLPLTHTIASHVLGNTLSARLVREDDLPESRVEYTDKLLTRLIGRMMGWLHTLLVDGYGLGDQYAIVNPDGTISLPSPDTVRPEYDPLDYRHLIKLTVTTKLQDYEITDEYREDGRTIRIKRLNVKAEEAPVEHHFPNLIGRLPVVHFANDRSGNELFGRPIYEALLRLFSRYDDLIEKGLDGAELMGNPVPVLTGVEDIKRLYADNQPEDEEDYYDVDGNEAIRDVFNFDTRAGMLLSGEAKFEFASPPTGFTEDIRNMLKLLFLLLLDHTRLPEALWGGAINSSKASADAQMPPFYQFIEGRRLAVEGFGGDALLGLDAQGGLLALLDIWLRYRALTDRQVLVAPVEMIWQDLSDVDWDVKWKWTSWLRQMGLITKVTAVEQSGLVEDAVAEVEDAEEEAQDDMSQDTFSQELAGALRMMQTTGTEETVTEPEDDETETANA